ncbi:serine hydrolase domain-containing protein [Dactylosporangium cerinum]|uniref:Serine hydrolase domain-containing protein n=1 Tax=Dactylosporangium cerinum TaxID=1434730 RepID=A0ABV9VXN0_9ACTN
MGKLAGAAGFGALTGGVLLGEAGRAAPYPPPPPSLPVTWTTTGTSVPALASFDDAMLTFMKARFITGGQLAVTYKGRLVLARGYSCDRQMPVQPTSTFRVASLSKSVTAAAVAKLAQDGKVTLGTPVTALLDFVPPTGQSVDVRLQKATLWRLLQHTGGWDRAASLDPLWSDQKVSAALGIPMELTTDDVVRYMAGRPLDFTPATRVAYSNYGYLLAAKVIEAVSGQTYGDYVNQQLLAPLGITRMGLGWSIAPFPNEVSYRSQYTGTTVLNMSGATVPAPYGTFSMRLQEGNGRWIASAVDLVRWASAFDAPGTLFNSTTLGRIWAVPGDGIGVNDSGWYYGLGWQVRPVTTGGTGRNTWHTGSMPGTYTLLVRTYNGMSWAALFNQRDDASGLSYSDIDPMLWTAAGKVSSWPTHNFYSKYFG